MKITILSVGSLKERFWKEAVLEYEKRISKFCKIECITVEDEAICENPSDKEIEGIRQKEGVKLLKVLPKGSFNIALDLKGNTLDSEELADKMDSIFSYQNGHICFIIGGSLGLGRNILDNVEYRLSFSKMTFPHGLAKVILLEQIYRCFKILRHEPYHK